MLLISVDNIDSVTMERIMIEVTATEFQKILERRDGKTWRELFLPAIGIETSRQRPGPDRKNKDG